MASRRTLDALALASVRLLVSAVVWWSGFRAISDDDYARVVIAQEFASGPAWDPSGTSWLPFPFWVQGSAMLLFGPALHTATAVAWASGVIATLLIWLGARALGLARGPAFLAAALASAIPYSAWLGVATVPELLTTGLVVFGVATLAKPCAEGNWARERSWGALALSCATLSRYETWPVAAVFTSFCLCDALRCRKLEPARARGLGSAALLASSGMLFWLLHGSVNHGDATFFIARVAHYQKALGGHDFDAWAAFSRHPMLVVTHAPALMGLAALGIALVFLLTLHLRWETKAARIEQVRSISAELPEPRLAVFTRPLAACTALVVFLMVGDFRGAGATHHAARTLLPVWCFACIVIALTWSLVIPRALQLIKERLVRERVIGKRFTGERFARGGLKKKSKRPLGLALVMSGVLVVDGLQNHVLDGALHFVDRSHELRLGERAQRVVTTGRLLIAPEDYGYFAMTAAFAAPRHVDTFDDHDPRHTRRGSLFEPPHTLRERLVRDQVQGLIVSQTYARQAQQFGTTVAMTPRYLLLAVPPPRK